MTPLSTLARDLVNKINDITAFGGRVAMTLGGTEADPTLSNLETPHAWVVLNSSQASSQDRERWTKVRYSFTVILGIPYGEGEANFIDNQLTLIEDVCQAVTGTQVTQKGPVWAFDGLSFIGGEPHLVRYSLAFSATAFYTQST